MSLTTKNDPHLSSRPSTHQDGETRLLRPSPSQVLFSLGLNKWRVEINARNRKIHVHRTHWWFTHSEETISFDAVSHIDYAYDEINTHWSARRASDCIETLTIRLILKDRRKIPLVSYSGSGSHETGMIGVLMGDSVVDYAGTQGGESRQFIDVLQELTGFPLAPPLAPVPDDDGCIRRCLTCDRTNSPFAKKCLYCGGEIAQEEA